MFLIPSLAEDDESSEASYELPDMDKPGPKDMLPFSSMYIMGPTNP